MAQAVVRFLGRAAVGARRPRAAVLRRRVRHLRPRQRRRHRPGAAAAARPRCRTTCRATSRRWCTPRRRSPRCATGCATLACTSSIGPGATNMVTGAAARHDQPAAGAAAARRHLRQPRPGAGAAAARVSAVAGHLGQRLLQAGVALLGPDQPAGADLTSALPEAMRVLTSPAETGAVTLALPQDVQAEAFDYPGGVVRAARLDDSAARAPDRDALAQAAAADSRSAAPAHHRRRRRALQRGDRGARAASSKRPACRRRNAGGQGRAAVRSSAGARRDRRHRNAGARIASRATPTSSSPSARG